MKKLTSNEFEQLSIKGKGRSSHLFNSIVNLKVGEGLLIEKKDWNRKAGPSTLVRYIEKNHKRKFACAAISGEEGGWAIKRIDDDKKNSQANSYEKNTSDIERLKLKSDLLVFYLGRMAFQKIERMEDSIKASVLHFGKSDADLIKELFYEIIKSLNEQGHIVIENEKTYIPLRKNQSY